MRPLTLLLILSTAMCAKGGTHVSVQIVSAGSAPESESHYQPSTLQCNNDGCTGTPGHSYSVVQNEVHAAAIINDDKVLLTCGERRRKTCFVLAPGTYTGEVKGKSVWITSTLPVTHETVKRRFDIVGVW